ncbi:MAG: S8 family serine peptidase [Planctomycetota bacterium]
MRPLFWCGPLAATVVAAGLFGQDLDADREHGIPGARAGTERWIVHFQKRSFDLSRFRKAIYDRRPAAEVDAIVKGLERQVVLDQRGFVAKVERDLGASIVAQWWLINACAIDVSPASLARIRALPNVARLEPDRYWAPCIRKATSSKNHNADRVHSVFKIDGSGVAVGIMDTGQDEKSGSHSRPHRTYFVKGDPANKTGKGMGGSRLVVNHRIGVVPADDVHGHGPAVASAAAGADWGARGADHGHAFGANVAGYSIALFANGNTSTTTVAKGWQQMATDRVKYNVVAANHSYAGSPNPLDAQQKAMDAAALNADILICTAAGNWTGTNRSQSNANGLAVAAMVPDTWVMASFSARGPLYRSGGRFVPDITACGVETVMAQRDVESIVHIESGTSFASPQVCGTAALVRAANTSLTALETKAVLLATTQSIVTQNPNTTRNNWGTGMLRTDAAVELALVRRTVGSSTIDSQNRTRKFPLSVQKDKQYAVVVTWHRTNVNSGTWSNLDFRVLDGNTVVAESKTPLNLYENAWFVAKRSATFSLEVTSPTLSGSSQKFAVALSEVPKAPVLGSVTLLGTGCKGTGLPLLGVCQSDNANQTWQRIWGSSNTIYALEIVANGSLSIEGFEMPTKSLANVTQVVPTMLFDGTSAGPNKVLATGTMTITGTVKWYRTLFDRPVSVAKGQKYFLAFLNPAATTGLGITTNGNITPYWKNNGPGGRWVRNTSWPWAWKTLCTSKIPGAVPAMATNGAPELGRTFHVTLRRASGGSSVLLLTGVSNSKWDGLSLPLSLTPAGAPGCTVYAAGHVLTLHKVDAVGALDLGFTVPVDKTLIGFAYYQQFAVRDQQANNFGFAVSNGLALRVGGVR